MTTSPISSLINDGMTSIDDNHKTTTATASGGPVPSAALITTLLFLVKSTSPTVEDANASSQPCTNDDEPLSPRELTPTCPTHLAAGKYFVLYTQSVNNHHPSLLALIDH